MSIAVQSPRKVKKSTRKRRQLHTLTADGRVQHSFKKRDGVWTCDCGERRDRYGRVL